MINSWQATRNTHLAGEAGRKFRFFQGFGFRAVLLTPGHKNLLRFDPHKNDQEWQGSVPEPEVLAATLCQVPRSVVVFDRSSLGIDFFGPCRSS